MREETHKVHVIFPNPTNQILGRRLERNTRFFVNGNEFAVSAFSIEANREGSVLKLEIPMTFVSLRYDQEVLPNGE